MTSNVTDLEENIDQDDEEGIGEVEQQPDLDRLDVGCAGKGGGDGHVDGGEHHHARDVHRDDQVIRRVPGDVVGGLVDDVHQQSRQVSHHEYTDLPFLQCNGYCDYIL